MAKVQVAPGVQVETEQLLIGMESMAISDLEQFRREFNELLARKSGPSSNGAISEEEHKHINKANLGSSGEIHQRQVHLRRKLLSENLSIEEIAELAHLNQQIEGVKEERLKHLRILTRVSDVPFEKLEDHYRPYFSTDTLCLLKEEIAEEGRRKKATLDLIERLDEEGDEEEQKETLEYLMEALDEDRLSYRKLFS